MSVLNLVMGLAFLALAVAVLVAESVGVSISIGGVVLPLLAIGAGAALIASGLRRTGG